MEQQLRDAAQQAAAWSTSGYSTGNVHACNGVWSHGEHQDLQVRYTKALEDLSAARHEVIRLTQEMAAIKGPRHRPPSAPSGDLSVNGASAHQLGQSSNQRPGSQAPLQPRLVLGPLLSRPPQEDTLAKYYDEIEGWVRPNWSAEQLTHIPNYLTSQAVVTNLRNAMVGLDGKVPTPADWKLWCADRLTVVRDVLDPGKTWRQQQDEHKRLAIAVLEKRWPALTLCEPDANWKAAQFLCKRVEEVIKVQHQEQRTKLTRENESQSGDNSTEDGFWTASSSSRR